VSRNVSQKKLFTVGEGTEQVENSTQHLFKGRAPLRIDRDSTSAQSAIGKADPKIHEHDQAILNCTQIAGRKSPFSENVTLVVIMGTLTQGVFFLRL